MEMDKFRKRMGIENGLGRALLGEFIGTAMLLMIVNSIVAQSVLSNGKMNEMININAGVGLAVAFCTAVCEKLSGGHINPAVSLMFLLFQQLSGARFLLYCLVQTAGAFLGAAVTSLVYFDAINDFDDGIRQVYGPKATAGIYASFPGAHLSALSGVIDQVVGTALFCFLIAHITDHRNLYPKYLQPMFIGMSFVMIGTAFGLNCGYPLNPARDFGPRLFTFVAGYGGEVFSYRNYTWFWVPVIGPFLGALLGGLFYQLIIGFHIPPVADNTENRKYETVTIVEKDPLTARGKISGVAVEQKAQVEYENVIG